MCRHQHPYYCLLSFRWLRNALAPILPARFISIRARSSCCVARKACSACSLRKLSSRAPRVPAAAAAATAQPGSPRGGSRGSGSFRRSPRRRRRRRRRPRPFPTTAARASRRVDQDPPPGSEDELPAGRRVPAAAVRLAHLARAQEILADQSVGDRRLADARRSEQRRRPPGGEPLAAARSTPAPSPKPRGPAPGRQRGDLGDERAAVVDEVRLVEDDDRRGAAVPCGHQIALDPPRIEIVVEARHEEHDVDVRGDDLLLGGIAGGSPREMRRPRQDGADPRVAAGAAGSSATQSPTAGKSARPRGVVAQASGHARQALARRRDHAIDVRVFEADARRDPGRRRDGARTPPQSAASSRDPPASTRRYTIATSGGQAQDSTSGTEGLSSAPLHFQPAAQDFGDAPGLRDAAARQERRARRRTLR